MVDRMDLPEGDALLMPQSANSTAVPSPGSTRGLRPANPTIDAHSPQPFAPHHRHVGAGPALRHARGPHCFLSETPIEDIQAESHEASAIFTTTGQLAFRCPSSFPFPKALMEEHFNENYMETERYPKATFRGQVMDLDLTATGPRAARPAPSRCTACPWSGTSPAPWNAPRPGGASPPSMCPVPTRHRHPQSGGRKHRRGHRRHPHRQPRPR